MPDRRTPTHTLRVDVPLDFGAMTRDGAAGPLDAVIGLVRLAFPTEVCDDITVELIERQGL